MKKLFYQKSYLVFSILGLCCSPPATPILYSRNKIQSVILNEYNKVGSCGTIAFAAAYIFTIESSNSKIIGIIRCPDTYGEAFFKKGENYKVQLSNVSINDSLSGYAIINPFEKLKYQEFLISRIYK